MQPYINPYNPPHPFRLTEKQRRFLITWERRRKQPRWQYLLIHGFIKQVAWLFLLLKSAQLFFFSDATRSFYNSPEGLFFLLFECIFWIFCGLTLGWMNYTQKETEYEIFRSQRHF